MNSIANTNRTVKCKDAPRVLKGQQTRTRTGMKLERSVLMQKGKAKHLCLALSALGTAEVVRDHHVTGDTVRYYVRWKRSGNLDCATAVEKMQDIRAERAVHQYAEMEIHPMPDTEGWYYVLHHYPAPKPGEPTCGVYETHPEQTCSCPDFAFRRYQTNDVCKHKEALLIHLGLTRRPVPPAPVTETPEVKAARRARYEESRYADYP